MKQSKEIDYTNLYLSSTKNISLILDDAVDRQQLEFLNFTSDFFWRPYSNFDIVYLKNVTGGQRAKIIKILWFCHILSQVLAYINECPVRRQPFWFFFR